MTHTMNSPGSCRGSIQTLTWQNPYYYSLLHISITPVAIRRDPLCYQTTSLLHLLHQLHSYEDTLSAMFVSSFRETWHANVVTCQDNTVSKSTQIKDGAKRWRLYSELTTGFRYLNSWHLLWKHKYLNGAEWSWIVCICVCVCPGHWRMFHLCLWLVKLALHQFLHIQTSVAADVEGKMTAEDTTSSDLSLTKISRSVRLSDWAKKK